MFDQKKKNKKKPRKSKTKKKSEWGNMAFYFKETTHGLQFFTIIFTETEKDKHFILN